MSKFNPKFNRRYHVAVTCDVDCDGVSYGYHKISTRINDTRDAENYLHEVAPYAGYTVIEVWSQERFLSTFRAMDATSRSHWFTDGYYNPDYDNAYNGHGDAA